jgi:hypothetical protein
MRRQFSLNRLAPNNKILKGRQQIVIEYNLLRQRSNGDSCWLIAVFTNRVMTNSITSNSTQKTNKNILELIVISYQSSVTKQVKQ